MIITNKKTGRDVSHLVVAMWEGLITQDEFELLAMIYEQYKRIKYNSTRV